MEHRNHHIHHLSQIGWSNPDVIKSNRPQNHQLPTERDFDVLVYHKSRYGELSPPSMSFLPSAELFNQMLEACFTGSDFTPVKTLNEMLRSFVEDKSTMIEQAQGKQEDR